MRRPWQIAPVREVSAFWSALRLYAAGKTMTEWLSSYISIGVRKKNFVCILSFFFIRRGLWRCIPGVKHILLASHFSFSGGFCSMAQCSSDKSLVIPSSSIMIHFTLRCRNPAPQGVEHWKKYRVTVGKMVPTILFNEDDVNSGKKFF